MKILFFGDSITDMARVRTADDWHHSAWGYGYVRIVADSLIAKDPTKYEFINRGISGNRTVDLYARIKEDVWNHNPDVMSLYIGVNDVWHDLGEIKKGVTIDRFEKIYRMIIEDTLKELPNLKIMLVEPFVVKGIATEEKWQDFLKVYDYAKVIKKIAKEYNFPVVELQEEMTKAVEKYGSEIVCRDGVHPNSYGMGVIAKQWLKVYNENFEK